MKRYALIASLLCMLGVPNVYADTGILSDVSVTRTLVSGDGRWGGCMILLDVPINTVLPNCPSRWLSFSCTGDFTTKDAANRMFDSAMMAKALERKVLLIVDDTKKHNGYCYASRIDVL